MFKAIFQIIRNRTLIEESNFRNYLSNISWLMVEKAFRVVVVFFIGIYIARFLGPEKFGLLSYALSFITLFSALTTLGLDAILIKELVNEPHKKDVLVGTVFRLRMGGALAALLLIGLFLLLVPHDRSSELLIFITAFTFLFQSFNVIDSFFQSKILSKYVVFVQLIQTVISAIFKLSLIFLKAPLSWFGFAVVLDSIVLAIGLSTVYLKHNFLTTILNFDYKTARQLLRSSFPLFLSEIAISFYMRVDQVIIKSMLGNKAVGFYAAAVIICEAFYFIPLAIIRTFFPVILNNKKTNSELYHRNLQKLYDLMVIISFFMALVISLTADKIVLLLFGPQFSEAIPALRIYAWTSIFVFLGAGNERWLLAENLHKYMFYRTFWGCLLSVGLNLILVPWLNIKGAAISALISFGFVSYLAIFIFKPLRNHFIIVSRSLNVLSGLKRILNIRNQ